MERQQAHIAPPSAPVEDVASVGEPDLLEHALAEARAPGADERIRRTFVDRLVRLDLGSPRATADCLQTLLSSGELATLRASDGTSARAVAVERLLDLGYPYALEVSPEDLAHWRAERPSEATDGRGLSVLVMTVAVCLSLWGVSDPPTGLGLSLVLALAAVTVGAAIRPGLSGWARRATFALGVICCALGFRYGVGTLLPGVAGLFTAYLLGKRGVRGVD
ncbi:MAG TPA: hypothetical protein VFN91_12030 [Myxococcaceae bacterium]|nr:hypothetical protein [Myxococcaceae bacterium]